MSDNRASALLGEAQAGVYSSLRNLLEQRNIEVLECSDGVEAINTSYAKSPDLIILDVALPRLNGYVCARILKNDPQLKSTPLIHIGSSQNAIEQYWSKTSGGDFYFPAPFNEMELDEILNRFLRRQGGKRRLLTPVRMVPELEENSILTLANNLLEQELLRASILNEINLMDISGMATDEFVIAIMAIIQSLFDFTLGAALLIYDPHLVLYLYSHQQIDPRHLDEIKKLLSKYLEQQHEIYLDAAQMEESIFHLPQEKTASAAIEDLYIHTKEAGSIRSVLALENIGFETLQPDEQEILQLALDLAHGVIEKKIFFQISQESSIIDGVTEGYSIVFFIEYLRREIENATRNDYALTLITLSIPNFEDIARSLNVRLKNDLLRIMQDGILKQLRKADIVARWETAAFAVLLPHTTLEKARVAQERIQNYLMKDLKKLQPSSVKFEMETGLCQFDPKLHRTPETFFAHAQPQNAPAKAPADKSQNKYDNPDTNASDG